jgi:hypothetical protein
MSLKSDGGMIYYTDRVKLKNPEKFLTQCHFVHHISHMD